MMYCSNLISFDMMNQSFQFWDTFNNLEILKAVYISWRYIRVVNY